jgi:hypothetical protein
MAAITLVEWMKTVTDPLRAGIIETLYMEEPIFQYIPFRTVPGLALPYTTESALPGVAFRNLNEAFVTTYGIVQRSVETLKPFGGDSDTDKVLVDAYGNTERSTRDAMFAKAMAVKYVQTFLYGNSPASRAGTAYDDVKGFDGIQARVTSGQTLDAGGTTGSDGSSVFAIRFGDGYCQGLTSPAGLSARDLGELKSGGPFYRSRIDMTAGMAIYNGASVAWLSNIRTTAGTDTVSTVLMDQLYDLIQGIPTVFVMSKRSRQQLKASAIGSGVALSLTLNTFGQVVETWNGVPIITSDAVIDTETNS